MDKPLVIKALKEVLPNFNQERLVNTTEPLYQVLSQQNEFVKSDNIHFNHGSGSSQFNPRAAAFFLCRQAIKFGEASAVESLIKIFKRKEADLLCIISVRGISCKNEICLTDSIKLIPMENLPPSSRKLSLQRSISNPRFDFDSLSAFNPTFIKPKDIERAFLITTIKIKPVLFDYHQKIEDELQNRTYNEAFTSLDETRLCLTALGYCSPLEEFRWRQYKDEELEDAANVSTGISISPIEIISTYLRKSKEINEKCAFSILKNYLNLPKNFKSRILIALNRLNLAMRRSTVGDIAVELSVALESLLLANEKGDNRFKVSLRSAIAFSENLSERLQCRKTIREMYDIRSKLVHDGKDSKHDQDAKKCVEEAIIYSATIIKNLIKNGEPSNWSELELSGKSLN